MGCSCFILAAIKKASPMTSGHGRTLCAPTKHFFDSLSPLYTRVPFRITLFYD